MWGQYIIAVQLDERKIFGSSHGTAWVYIDEDRQDRALIGVNHGFKQFWLAKSAFAHTQSGNTETWTFSDPRLLLQPLSYSAMNTPTSVVLEMIREGLILKGLGGRITARQAKCQ